jgi:hypothetical protein
MLCDDWFTDSRVGPFRLACLAFSRDLLVTSRGRGLDVTDLDPLL